MVKIGHHAALVLLLGTAALVSGLDSRPRRLSTRTRINQVMYSLLCRGYEDLGSSLADICSGSDRDDTEIRKEYYNGEGFRKEQWHNYPRRLDRLQSRTPRQGAAVTSDSQDRGDPERAADYPDVDIWKPALATPNLNELVYDTNLRSTNGLENAGAEKRESDDVLYAPDKRYENKDETRRIQKRMFSLWTRLKGLGPVGHELQHRRHFYATYAAPDGALTAETRGGLLRPAGSPLRWG